MSTAHTTTKPKTETLLDTLAKHELAVLDQIKQSEREATSLVEKAHTEAATILATESRLLDEKTQTMRAAMEQSIDAEISASQEQTARQLEAIRNDATPRISQIVNNVLDLVLPQGHSTRG